MLTSFIKKRKAAPKATVPLKVKTDGSVMHCRIDTDLFVEAEDGVQSWRIFRIMSEFVEGFTILRRYTTAATIFGSARLTPDDKYYQEAEELSGKLAKKGFAIITGGGPGIMEAANAGAFRVGGQSVGLNIKLPMEQKFNQYVTDTRTFHFFFSRKVMLAFASEVYVYFPGGFGTLDEFMEIITLIQTKKIQPLPVVLYGKEFWTPIVTFFKEQLLEKYQTISKEDLDIFQVVDSVDEAYDYIMEHANLSTPRQI